MTCPVVQVACSEQRECYHVPDIFWSSEASHGGPATLMPIPDQILDGIGRLFKTLFSVTQD
jgi:hypothetical protein